MSDIEWLVGVEEIRQLKARRDRYADAHDWDVYEALHAPDHASHNDEQEPWTSSKEMIENVSRIMGDIDHDPTTRTIQRSSSTRPRRREGSGR